jgi:hypothetical protein
MRMRKAGSEIRKSERGDIIMNMKTMGGKGIAQEESGGIAWNYARREDSQSAGLFQTIRITVENEEENSRLPNAARIKKTGCP